MRLYGWILSLGLGALSLASGCGEGLRLGDGDGDESGSGGDARGAAGAGDGGLGGFSGTGEVSSTGGAAGAGGALMPRTPGLVGHALVSGGAMLRSSKYRLWVSMGDSPGAQGVRSSTKYRLESGVVGTSQ